MQKPCKYRTRPTSYCHYLYRDLYYLIPNLEGYAYIRIKRIDYSSNPNRAYCGTFGDDGGQTWNSLGKVSMSSKDVMSVAVSHHHLKRENNGFNTVYVGTEHTALYRSDYGFKNSYKVF